MIKMNNYGAVYTPDNLADFIAELLYNVVKNDKSSISSILDPSIGGGALIKACNKYFSENTKYYGIDIDYAALVGTTKTIPTAKLIHTDAILPKNMSATNLWNDVITDVDCIVANPPWSSEKIYNQKELLEAGYTLGTGQYDSYVLFIELSYKLLMNDGYCAFILPDSIFDTQNSYLRKWILDRFEIKIIARLGEKIFPGVNRSTSVLIMKKSNSSENNLVNCFRLNTKERKEFLTEENIDLYSLYKNNSHQVLQNRFLNNERFVFDIDLHTDEEIAVKNIYNDKITLKSVFKYSRGIEISKSGKVLLCPYCEKLQGFTTKQLNANEKICIQCKRQFNFSFQNVIKVINKIRSSNNVPIIVGEDIGRYKYQISNYIDTNISGINYKSNDTYLSPKLLVRKTGLGINTTVDYNNSFTTQTVFILRPKKISINDPIEFYEGILNSRVIFYFYLKKHGEIEWKSHPYITKDILMNMPTIKYTDTQLNNDIIKYVKELNTEYNHKKDIMLEHLIMNLFNLNIEDRKKIIHAMNSLPNLGAINNLKLEMV